jgi:NTP pyrophosphatase (non-canonical NTP hydrolase)
MPSQSSREGFEQLVTEILVALEPQLTVMDGPDVDDAREAVMRELLAHHADNVSGVEVTGQTSMVLLDVARERQRQDEKWGPCARPPLEWLGIIAEEFGEVAEKVVKGWVPPEGAFDAAGYREELMHLAASSVSAAESLDYGTAGLGRIYPPEACDAA